MRGRGFLPLAGALALLALGGPALAQAHNPFGVGISEGGGSASGLAGWLLAEQATFERQLSAAIRAVHADGGAVWWLAGLSFAYGVFHAAGPGHGKAVMTAYLFANERALRRGLVLSLLAALLQGAVAVALVGALALVLHATAMTMRAAASQVEMLSYAGVATLGAWLMWRKGRSWWATWQARPSRDPLLLRFPGPLPATAVGVLPEDALAGRGVQRGMALSLACDCVQPGVFRAEAAHGPDCGHVHMPDPAALGDGFSWREAALTVMAAGVRPCSGAILVLIFALTQGLFLVGIAAVFAMSLGTAITTGALAATAVLARGVARRLTRGGSFWGALAMRTLELGAAALVLVVGLCLLLGVASPAGA